MLNYILNKVRIYENPPFNFTFGDIQTAIWQTIIGTGITNVSAPFNPANVMFILNDALTNSQFYKPTAPTDAFAIFIAPVVNGMLSNQLLMLQVTVAQFPVPCASTGPSPVPVLLPPAMPVSAELLTSVVV